MKVMCVEKAKGCYGEFEPRFKSNVVCENDACKRQRNLRRAKLYRKEHKNTKVGSVKFDPFKKYENGQNLGKRRCNHCYKVFMKTMKGQLLCPYCQNWANSQGSILSD